MPPHLRNLVGGTDVKEVACCERDEKGNVSVEGDRAGQQAARQKSQCRAGNSFIPGLAKQGDAHAVIAVLASGVAMGLTGRVGFQERVAG